LNLLTLFSENEDSSAAAAAAAAAVVDTAPKSDDAITGAAQVPGPTNPASVIEPSDPLS
jgi:hypothetical protein